MRVKLLSLPKETSKVIRLTEKDIEEREVKFFLFFEYNNNVLKSTIVNNLHVIIKICSLVFEVVMILFRRKQTPSKFVWPKKKI